MNSNQPLSLHNAAFSYGDSCQISSRFAVSVAVISSSSTVFAAAAVTHVVLKGEAALNTACTCSLSVFSGSDGVLVSKPALT